MAIKLFSSQTHRSASIVEAKLDAGDLEVQVVFTADPDTGEPIALVVDGHYSLEAAFDAGVEPELVEAEWARIELKSLGLEEFCERHMVDSDWADVQTGSTL